MGTRARFEAPHPVARIAPFAGIALLIVGLSAWLSYDARSRRAARDSNAETRSVAARAVGPEIALHSASRWLRHPTRSEPWAASADGPAMLDLDPAGALAPPPVEVLRAGLPATRLAIRHAGSR